MHLKKANDKDVIQLFYLVHQMLDRTNNTIKNIQMIHWRGAVVVISWSSLLWLITALICIYIYSELLYILSVGPWFLLHPFARRETNGKRSRALNCLGSLSIARDAGGDDIALKRCNRFKFMLLILIERYRYSYEIWFKRIIIREKY